MYVPDDQPSLETEWISIDRVIPYENNARAHPESQIRGLMASLTEFKTNRTIKVDEHCVVLCGHGQLKAHRRLEHKMVPVTWLTHLSEAQKKAFRLADNALGDKSNWQSGLLKGEIQELIELGFDVELAGFSTLEIDTVLNIGDEEPDTETAAADNEQVELPGESPPLTQLGDHWIIGRHHVLCADAVPQSSLESLLHRERAELVFMDPPYNCKISGHVSGLGKTRHENFVMGAGEMSDAEYVMNLLRPVMRQLTRSCQSGAIAFICSDWRAYPRMLEAAAGVFAEQKNLIVWAKTNAGMGSFYRSQTELIAAFKVSRGTNINNFELGQGGRHRSNLWTYPGANTFRKGRIADLTAHPTVKPQKLVADAILDCSRRGGIVLDPFLGSGTTLAAAAVTGRRGYGLELDPKYVDVTLRRLQKLTGQMPRLIDGTPLDDVARARGIDWEGGR